jgi:hypothetical protein
MGNGPAMNKLPSKFVIFDFSGTLSLAAVEFSRSENLVPALEASGLFAMGVTTESFFWDEIVYPTWVEGSTTSRGYQAVLVERIAALGLHAPVPGDSNSEASIQKAVTDLLRRYFDQCRIDRRWRTLLHELQKNPAVQVLVATDHYAEATPLIKARLADWNIEAIGLSEAAPGVKNPFIVANSSDLGWHKADIRYWERIRQVLEPDRQDRILLVDDFGGNEDSSDPYGDPARVTTRRMETGRVLREVFPGPVDIYPFVIDRSEISHSNMSDKNGLYGSHIARAILHIQLFLTSRQGA